MIRYPIALTLSLLLLGCSLDERITETGLKIEDRFAEVKSWDELPSRSISWNQALAMMEEGNASIIKANSSIASAERQVLSVYTDLIPSFSYYGSMTKSISEWTQSSSLDGANSNINVSFSLPSLTQVPYQVYSAKASEFAARKSKEASMREIQVKLYSLVRTHELSAKTRAADKLDYEKSRLDRSVADLDAQRKEGMEYWKTVAETIGNSEARWHILPETMPRISWGEYSKKLERLDPLVVCQFSLTVEQARLRQYGVALRYLPTLNTSLYSPQLFSSTGGTYEGAFLDSDDTTLNLSLSYDLDTRLDNWNNYKDNKENFEMVCQDVFSDLRERKEMLLALKKSVQAYHQWQNYMQKRIHHLESIRPSTSLEYVKIQKDIQAMKRELLTQESRAIESESAVAMEYGLPKKK